MLHHTIKIHGTLGVLKENTLNKIKPLRNNIAQEYFKS